MAVVNKQLEAALTKLDSLIYDLETNLGKKHTVSPFDKWLKKSSPVQDT